MASTKNIYTDDGIWPLQKTFIQMMGYHMASIKNIYTDDGIWPLQKTFIQMMECGLYKKHLNR